MVTRRLFLAGLAAMTVAPAAPEPELNQVGLGIVVTAEDMAAAEARRPRGPDRPLVMLVYGGRLGDEQRAEIEAYMNRELRGRDFHRVLIFDRFDPVTLQPVTVEISPLT